MHDKFRFDQEAVFRARMLLTEEVFLRLGLCGKVE